MCISLLSALFRAWKTLHTFFLVSVTARKRVNQFISSATMPLFPALSFSPTVSRVFLLSRATFPSTHLTPGSFPLPFGRRFFVVALSARSKRDQSGHAVAPHSNWHNHEFRGRALTHGRVIKVKIRTRKPFHSRLARRPTNVGFPYSVWKSGRLFGFQKMLY